eukprot:NODE_12872_length_1198_cov_6.834734.p1 GENE.NODE_12872_length_1198_cov_6.834734~~NODE_12872_length_1198_cov_6.834734.p1  ORF type:complete len:327 (+),score=72.36 NODE_12872_length_1198_cov_6.834734:131-982(+)
MVHLRRDSGRRVHNKGAVLTLLANSGLRFVEYEPLGLDTPLATLAGGVILVSKLLGLDAPGGWPTDLFDGAGLVNLWKWARIGEAKARVEEHVLSRQHVHASRGELTGVCLDGSFGIAPPVYWAGHLQDWFFEGTEGAWAGSVPRLGLVMVDFVSPRLCSAVIAKTLQMAATRNSCSGGGGGTGGNCLPAGISGVGSRLSGVCHIGPSAASPQKVVRVASRHPLPEGCCFQVSAYMLHDPLVLNFSTRYLCPDAFELTVRRMNLDSGIGWGEDLFVQWEAHVP